MFGNRFLQIGCDKRLDDDSARGVLFRQNSKLEKFFRPVVRHQRSNLITAK